MLVGARIRADSVPFDGEDLNEGLTNREIVVDDKNFRLQLRDSHRRGHF